MRTIVIATSYGMPAIYQALYCVANYTTILQIHYYSPHVTEGKPESQVG